MSHLRHWVNCRILGDAARRIGCLRRPIARKITGRWWETEAGAWVCHVRYFHTTSLRTVMIHDELSFNLDNWNHDSLVYCWRHLPPRSWTTTEISNCHPTTTTDQTARISIIHGTTKKARLKINCKCEDSSPKWLCDQTQSLRKLWMHEPDVGRNNIDG